MNHKDAIMEIIYAALCSLNEELEDVQRVALAPDTKLFGADASLDSLSLVSVIVDVETAVADELGKVVSLTDDKALNQEISPFSDVTALANYIASQLEES